MKAMFKHRGKADSILGKKNINNYENIYNHLDDLQSKKELPFNGKYLSDNELASNIYKKKYYLKDLKNNIVETCPEDVFKRVSAFIASAEKTKSKLINEFELGTFVQKLLFALSPIPPISQ